MKTLRQFLKEAKKPTKVVEETNAAKNVKSIATKGVKPDTSEADLAAKVFRIWTGTNV